MAKVVNLRFHDAGKPYRFLAGDLKLKVGDAVMVNTALGQDIAFVVDEPFDLPEEKVDETILSVLRYANEKEMEHYHEKKEREKSAFYKCLELIEKRELPMTLVEAVYSFDGRKLTFYFTADKRVDFRELVKDLTSCFRTRIELRQIGSREQAKMVGGLGICGRELCCATWMKNFISVTTGAARYQDISLNPQKLAGMCAKLKCCLNFEQATYAEEIKKFPDPKLRLLSKKGKGVYNKIDIFKKIVWYNYAGDNSTMFAIPLDKVNEIIELNKKNQMPDDLESFAVVNQKKEEEVNYSLDELKNIEDK